MILGNEADFRARSEVWRICDQCGQRDATHYEIVVRGRRRRGDDRDLCWRCANKARKLPHNEQNGNWKHGITSTGYKRINRNGERIAEHRAVMEDRLGRKLKEGEVVHHIDYNKTNNKTDNLWLYSSDVEHTIERRSLQSITLLFFRRGVWFDYERKKYVQEETACPHRVLSEVLSQVEVRNVKDRKLTYQECKWNGAVRRFHIVVMEEIIGRGIYQGEGVHHVDLNPLNNDPNNLCLMTHKEHRMCHCSLEMCGIDLMKQGRICFENGHYMLAN